MNILKLKGKLVENQFSIATISRLLEVDKSTFYRKLKHPESITIGEARIIRNALNLTEQEAHDIFFS